MLAWRQSRPVLAGRESLESSRDREAHEVTRRVWSGRKAFQEPAQKNVVAEGEACEGSARDGRGARKLWLIPDVFLGCGLGASICQAS